MIVRIGRMMISDSGRLSAACEWSESALMLTRILGLALVATVAVAVRLLDRLLDFDELAALPDGDGRDGDRR
jgi:hypothetical protein